MAYQRLKNYLRTFRRRHGFSEREVASLLGAFSGTKVSRYENFTRMPAAITVFALEIVFNQPMSELFAGNYETVRAAVKARAKRLLKRLAADPQQKQNAKTLRKLELLRSIIESKPNSARRCQP